MFGPEHKNVAAMRFHKVIAEFIDENLVTGVDRAPGNNFVATISNPRRNLEVRAQLVWRAVNHEMLVLADDPRPGEEEEKLLLLDLEHLIVLLRNYINIIASTEDELRDLLKEIRRRFSHGPADNSVQGRLHRAGGNLERLQKIRADANRYDYRNQNDFNILAPVRFPRHRSQFV